jgi:iron-sulfur cluster assembly accessory protein
MLRQGESKWYTEYMNITPFAQNKISLLIKETQITIPDKEIFLRLAVQPGGCSGLRYKTYFDYEKHDSDSIYNYEGFNFRVDKMSTPYLDGATLDFEDTIEKQGFTIDNPNAQGSCACGDSFN